MISESGALSVTILAVLGAVGIFFVTLFFVLRENLRDRRKRAIDLSGTYHRRTPPVLPDRRAGGGPPQLPRRN